MRLCSRWNKLKWGLKSGIVTAALPLLMPARLWTIWLEITGQKGRDCYAHQMCRMIWDNLYGELKTCGLTVFGCISTKEQNYIGKNPSNANLVLNISTMKVLMWTLSTFLAMFHNSCLKQHRNMFNLICVLHTETKARSDCQTRSLFPLFRWWPWILEFLCHKSSLHIVWILLSATRFSVPCCALFQWDNDQGNCWDMDGLPGICHEKAVQSSAHMLWAGSHFQSRDAHRGDH